jgi:hypothetical protein
MTRVRSPDNPKKSKRKKLISEKPFLAGKAFVSSYQLWEVERNVD